MKKKPYIFPVVGEVHLDTRALMFSEDISGGGTAKDPGAAPAKRWTEVF